MLRAGSRRSPAGVGRSASPVGELLSALCLTEARVLVILLTMTTLPLGEVKSHLSELVGRVHDHHERVTVTVHGGRRRGVRVHVVVPQSSTTLPAGPPL